MSKKSYKRNQNRLYREIKRRVIAENQIIKPISFVKCEQKIETLKIRHIIPDYIEDSKENIELIKSDMAIQIAKKLVEDDYVWFNYFGKYSRIADDEEIMNIKEIEAVINVLHRW